MGFDGTDIHFVKESSELARHGKTGISLHCHTMRSKEMLDFLPHYAEKMPIIGSYYKAEEKKYSEREGRGIDFSTAFWSPPLTPQAVYDSERKQINDSGLEAIVSITDHDEICGAFEIASGGAQVPISLEWTVPFEIGFFHMGVHNLPADRSQEITDILLAYTNDPESHSVNKLNELLEMLNEIPSVLLVLNHPIWDIELIGAEAHMLLLERFLDEHRHWIHALEINGFRAWSENKAVLELAADLGMPVVSGGDRHGCQANTVVNISDVTKFEDFVAEVREDGRSSVAVMPSYNVPLYSRQMRSFSEILTHYPEFPEGRQKWFDRVHFDIGDGKGLVPLSAHGWRKGGPVWLRMAIRTLGFIGSERFIPVFRLLAKKADRVPSNYGNPRPLETHTAGEFSSEAA